MKDQTLPIKLRASLCAERLERDRITPISRGEAAAEAGNARTDAQIEDEAPLATARRCSLLPSAPWLPFRTLRSSARGTPPLVRQQQEGFALATDVSCHSFIRMAKLAEPLMARGGCLLTVTFYLGTRGRAPQSHGPH